MSLTIQGMGTALPPDRIAQDDASSIAAEVALLDSGCGWVPWQRRRCLSPPDG